MSLTDFKRGIETISGVKSTRFVQEDTLQVVWEGEPQDYSSQVRQLRDQHPAVEQVSPPAEHSTYTPDQMPIAYYRES